MRIPRPPTITAMSQDAVEGGVSLNSSPPRFSSSKHGGAGKWGRLLTFSRRLEGDAVDEARREEAHPAPDAATERPEQQPLPLLHGLDDLRRAPLGGHDLVLLQRAPAEGLAIGAEGALLYLGDDEVGSH